MGFALFFLVCIFIGGIDWLDWYDGCTSNGKQIIWIFIIGILANIAIPIYALFKDIDKMSKK